MFGFVGDVPVLSVLSILYLRCWRVLNVGVPDRFLELSILYLRCMTCRELLQRFAEALELSILYLRCYVTA